MIQICSKIIEIKNDLLSVLNRTAEICDFSSAIAIYRDRVFRAVCGYFCEEIGSRTTIIGLISYSNLGTPPYSLIFAGNSSCIRNFRNAVAGCSILNAVHAAMNSSIILYIDNAAAAGDTDISAVNSNIIFQGNDASVAVLRQRCSSRIAACDRAARGGIRNRQSGLFVIVFTALNL